MKRWLLLVFLASCASAAKPAMTNAPAPAMVPESPKDPHARIQQLADEIDTETHQQATPVPGMHAMAAGATPFAATDMTCKPGPSDTCTETCNLGTSICGNAKKICDIAKDLQGDDWAADKCSSANKSCDSARSKCCSCQ